MVNNKILVLGSFMVDLMGRTPHLPVHGETVKCTSNLVIGPGGKGSNQAVAAKRSGGNVDFIAKIGSDTFSTLALDTFSKEGFNLDLILRDKEVPTGTALVMVDENTSQNMITVHPGSNCNITKEDIESIRPYIESADILLLQMEINIDALETIVEIAAASKTKIVLNPAPVDKISDVVYRKVDILTPNEVEAEELTGIKINTVEDAKKASDILLGRGVKSVVITLGSKGAYIQSASISEFIPCHKVKAVDTTGAGDAFNGGFVSALSRGCSLVESAKYASVVAGLSVTKVGTTVAMPYIDEINQFINSLVDNKNEN